jgi:hypothetical protein
LGLGGAIGTGLLHITDHSQVFAAINPSSVKKADQAG